jgi:hypothetical protein
MQYDVSMTPPQLEALWDWAEVGGAYPGDILLVREGDNLVAGQGDARVRISPAGDTVSHPEPFEGGEAARTHGLPMDSEQLVRFVLSWGREEGEDGDTIDPDLAVNGWDDRNVERCARELEWALTTAPASTHEPDGDRIAREGAAMLAAACDVDYDPAAEDEDGEPAEAAKVARERAEVAGDPRGERDA